MITDNAVRGAEERDRLDIGILLWLQEHVRGEILDPVMKLITSLGDIGLIWIVIGACFVVQKKYRTTGLLIWAALLLEWLLVDGVIKNLVMRTRPFNADARLLSLIEPPGSWSFPSGHSGSSFAAAAVMCLRLPKKFALSGVVLAVLIAFSRLYVGVHYPTDVLAGALVGTAVGWLCCKAAERMERRRADVRKPKAEE